MTRQFDYNFLRNPFLILITYGIIIIPSFLTYCGFNLFQPLGPALTEAPSCTTEFVSEIFLGQSILSFFLVIVSYESLRFLVKPFKLSQLPNGMFAVLFFEARVFIGLAIGVIVYAAIAVIIFWVNEMNSSSYLNIVNLSIYDYILMIFSGLFFVNLLLVYRVRANKKLEFSHFIASSDAFGKTVLDVRKIDWFEKKGRSYFAISGGVESRISYNLQTLEERLNNVNFFRINRSVIINIGIISDYAYWENEKYILKTNKNKEFVITRNRLNELKIKLGS